MACPFDGLILVDHSCEPRNEVPVSEGGTYRPPPPPTPTIDCQADGVGGGTFLDFEGGECSYTLNISGWCVGFPGGAPNTFQIDSPPGTFLVEAGDEGQGLAFFRWSDGTETGSVRVC